MRRVVYCPEESLLDEAVKLSKMNFLQIQVGDSSSTADLVFNRNVVSVIEIPEFRHYKNIKNVYSGFHQIIHYTNDYVDFDDTLQIVFESKSFRPVMLEKHISRFAFICADSGSFKANIMHQGEIMESIEFNVD